jgi:Ser-tRNA(Ala) deacylase AlaX
MKEEAILEFKRNSSEDSDEYYKKLKEWVKKQ